MDKDAKGSAVSAIRTMQEDLGKEADAILTPQSSTKGGAQNEKQLFDVERAFNENSVQIGTIVTDKKRSHPSFGTVLKSAFKEWWKSTETSVKRSADRIELLNPKEVPKVESPITRSATIKEAARFAAQAPRDDHNVVVEKIRTLARDAEHLQGKPFVIKPPEGKVSFPFADATKADVRKDAVTLPKIQPQSTNTSAVVTPLPSSNSLAEYAQKDTSRKGVTARGVPAFTVSPVAKKNVAHSHKKGTWTHFTDAPVNADAPPPQSIKNPEARTTTIQETLRVTGAPIQKKISTTEVPGLSQKVTNPEAQSSATSISRESMDTLRVSALPTQEPVQPPSAVSPKPEISPHIPPVTRINTATAAKPVSHTDSTLRNVWKKIALAVLAVGVIGVGMYGVFLLSQKSDTSEPIETVRPSAPSFLTVDTSIPVAFTPSRSDLFAVIEEQIGHSFGLTHVYPLNESGEPVNAREIMRLIAPYIDGGFSRSIDSTMMLGGVGEGRHPFIVLKTSNFDVAFAGMLAWERTMSEDLAPLFGTPVLGTIPPVGTTMATDVRFMDALVSNLPIRVLYDETGTERISYAMLNNNLIVITTSRDALQAIIERTAP